MDATITYDEVATLVGVNIPMLEPRPNFERIRMLRRHLERALQHLPCPQSVGPGWQRLRRGRSMVARWSHPWILAIVVIIVVSIVTPPPVPSAAAAVDKGGGAMAGGGGANVRLGWLKLQRRQRLPPPRFARRHRRHHRPLTDKGSNDGR